MVDSITIRASIYRCDPSTGAGERYETFELDGSPHMRVLDALRRIYEEQAGDLAFQYACRIGRCGTCAVQVNGRAVLSCQERAQPEMTIEPIPPFEVLRDLVVDRSEVNERYAEMALAPQRAQPHPGRAEAIDTEVAYTVGQLGTCISCMVCVASCPAVAERPFDGPAAMLQLRRLAEHPSDHGPRLEQALERGLLECYGCDACTEMCPADLAPADAIRSFRREALLGGRRVVGGEAPGSSSGGADAMKSAS